MESKLLTEYINEAMGEMDMFGIPAPAINAPGLLASAIREHVFDTHSEAQLANIPFIIVYWDVQEGRKMMLLAINGKVNVGQLVAPWNGKGNASTAMLKAPSLRDIRSEGIPLAEESPPDDLDVLVLLAPPFGDGPNYWRQAHHYKDGEFNDKDQDSFIAWSYLPEYEEATQH